MFTKLYGLVSSWRMAVWLIAAFLVVVTAGQFAGLSHGAGSTAKALNALGLTRPYTSWPFYALAALLVVNISACMAKRIAILFADRPEREEEVFWSGKRLPLLGSLLFHLGMLVIIAGVCYSAATRMEGRAYITEGEVFTDAHGEYRALYEAPLFFENHGLFNLRLNKVTATVVLGVLTEMTARATIADGGDVFERTAGINYPLVYKNTSFLINRYGFAPLFIFRDARGGEIFRSYVKLSSTTPLNEDNFVVPGTRLSVSVKFSPDAEVVNGKIKPRSRNLEKPLLALTVDEEIADGGIFHRLYRGVLKPGETAEFRNHSVTFGDLRYWVQFDVGKDRGRPIIFAGFWLCAAGLALRFLAAFGLRPLGFLEDK